MNDKMKACFTPHAIMHSLFGFGLGFLVAGLYTSHKTVWIIGLVVMVIAFILDAMRKN